MESNSYESDPVVISHIIHMIEVDTLWHHKIFEVVLADHQRSWDEEIHEQENKALHCSENGKTSWMRKKLSTSAVKVRLQPVKSAMEKKSGNGKVMTQRRAKQLQGWRIKMSLKRIIKWMKLRESKQQ